MPDLCLKTADSRIGFLTSRGFQLYVLLLTVTTIVTWTTGVLDNQYKPQGPTAGFGDVFPGNSEFWQLLGDKNLLSPEPGKFQISEDTGFKTRAEYLIGLPILTNLDDTILRVRSVVNTLQRPSKHNRRARAGLLIRLLDADGERLSTSWVAQLTGEFSPQKDEKLIALTSAATSAQLLFINRGSDGRFELEQVALDIVRVSSSYKLFIFPVLVILWGASLIIGMHSLATRMGKKRTLLLSGALLVLVGGIVLPTGLREIIIRPALDAIKSTGLPGSNISLLYYYKIGHFLMFFAVSLVLFQNMTRLLLSRIDLCAVMLILAIATEGAQLHLFFRTTQSLDMLIDMAGVALALLVHQLLRILADGKKDDRSILPKKGTE